MATQQALATVRRPLIYAGIIALLAILPMAVLEGRPGAFFNPMVVAYATAVVAALIVGMTVGPALNSLFARWQPKAGSPSGLWRGSVHATAAVCKGSPRPSSSAGCAACGVAVAILPFLNTALTPTFQDRNVVVKLQGAPDVSAPAMTQRATEIGNSLRSLPGVTGVGATVGRAITGDRVVNVNSSDWVAIAGDADYEATLDSIKDTVGQVPGMTEVVPFSTQDMRDVEACRRAPIP